MCFSRAAPPQSPSLAVLGDGTVWPALQAEGWSLICQAPAVTVTASLAFRCFYKSPLFPIPTWENYQIKPKCWTRYLFSWAAPCFGCEDGPQGNYSHFGGCLTQGPQKCRLSWGDNSSEGLAGWWQMAVARDGLGVPEILWGQSSNGGRQAFLCSLLRGGNIHSLKPTPVLWTPHEVSLSDRVNIDSFSVLNVPYLVPSLSWGLQIWPKLCWKCRESGVLL